MSCCVHLTSLFLVNGRASEFLFGETNKGSFSQSFFWGETDVSFLSPSQNAPVTKPSLLPAKQEALAGGKKYLGWLTKSRLGGG